MTLNELAAQAHATAKSKGWWDEDNLPASLLLIHAEVSEAAEAYRDARALGDLIDILIDPATGKPEGFAVELADVLIRTFSLCGRLGIDMDRAVRLKMAYNTTRPHRHGNKVI